LQMEIISTKVLKGPNYWSGYRTNLIEMKLDLGRFEDLPSNLLPGFTGKLLTLLPGLRADHCSEGHEGGFVERLEEGTWLGHVIEHVALELQHVAGMDCGYGRTRSTGDTGVYHVVYAYEYEEAGKLAGIAAFRLVSALASGETYDISEEVSLLQKIDEQQRPGQFAKEIMQLAKARNIPFRFDAEDCSIKFGQGIRQRTVSLPLPDNKEQWKPDGTGEASILLDNLYPRSQTARIPVIAITGTNGKTTTTRLLAHIAKLSGLSVGFTSTDGIFVNGDNISAGDCSGPKSAATLLDRQDVEFAILECARGGILRSGLAFDHCNVSIVTNISEDHIGIGDIRSVEQLAKVKFVVPRSTFKEGCAVLNAADPLVLRMRDDLDCRIALFAIDETLADLIRHTNAGGTAAYISDGYFTIAQGGQIFPLLKVEEVPLTFHGTSGFMIQNVLASILAAVVSGFSLENIISGIKTFYPSVEQTPGRLNVFNLKKGKFILDYVHNTGGYIAVKSFLSKQEAIKKTGIIYATGDRRPEDIRAIGNYAAEMFDEIIINNTHEPRGSDPDKLTGFLLEGIRQINPDLPVKILPTEQAAIAYAIGQCQENELIFASVNDIAGSIKLLTEIVTKEFPKMY
jgi:UDP-N-acetylmuramyl tripeptide synthase